MSNNLAPVLFKTALLSTIIFWTFSISKDFQFNFFSIAIIIFSYVPILILCLFALLFTISPIFLLENNNLSNKEMFKKYFPYYSIISFIISAYFVISSNFNDTVLAINISSFFTLTQMWLWLCTPDKVIRISEKEENVS